MFWYIFNRFKSEMKLIEYLLVYIYEMKNFIFIYFLNRLNWNGILII